MNTLRRTLSTLTPAAALLAGCGAPAEPAVAPTPAPIAPIAAAPPPTAAPSAAPVELAPPPSPFTEVTRLPGTITLYPVEGALLVASSTTIEAKDFPAWMGADAPTAKGEEMYAASLVGVLEGDHVRFPRRLAVEGLYHQIVAIDGRWPDALDLLSQGTTGRTGVAEHWALGEKGWVQKQGTMGLGFLGLSRVGQAVVGLQVPLYMVWEPPSFVGLRGKRPRYVITPGSREACRFDGDPSELRRSALRHAAFGGTADGQLIAFGSTCKGEPAVEVWKPGAAISTLHVFTGHVSESNGEPGASVLRGAANDVWLLAGFVAHYDGAAWTFIDPPPDETIIGSGAVSTDGTLWVVTPDGHLSRRTGDHWQPVDLPFASGVEQVAAGSDGSVWATAGGALLKYGKAAGAAPPAPPPPRDKKPPVRLPRPGSARCDHNLVVLYGFTKVTPDDYDFPLARKALQGHGELAGVRFVVTRDFGQKYFSALVPSFEVGKKVAAIIQGGVQGSRPQVLCSEPEVLREVKVDLLAHR